MWQLFIPGDHRTGDQVNVLPKRKWLWEKRAVKSSIPAPERPARCKACRVDVVRKELRYGYCGRCWTE